MRDEMVVTGQVSGTGNGGGQVPAARWSVPGYTEVKALGSGGFGDVVLARHDASGSQVAIKYLRRELLADAEFAELFRGEAAVLAGLDDPHVVRLSRRGTAAANAAADPPPSSGLGGVRVGVLLRRGRLLHRLLGQHSGAAGYRVGYVVHSMAAGYRSGTSWTAAEAPLPANAAP